MNKLYYLAAPIALALASCAEGGSGQPASAVPQNTPPTINGPSSVTVEENTATVATYTTTDAQGNPVTLSLQGTDAGRFSISGGVLSFALPADFEAPGDADADNVYQVSIVADDTFTTPTTLAVTVTVTDVVGDSIPQTSQNVTTDATTFEQTNLISSFEYPLLIQQDTDFAVTGVFADQTIAQNGWNNFANDPALARIGDASVSTCEITGTPGDCDAPQGEILIQNVEVLAGSITFLMSGGNGGNNVGVEIIDPSDDSVLASYTPNSCGDPFLKGDQHYVHFETSGLIGETINLRVFDEESGGCGFIAFDHFYQTESPRGPQAASVSKPLDPVNVTKEAAADTGLLPQASFEAIADMVNNRGWVATGAFAAPATDTAWQGTTRFDVAARLGNLAVSTCEMNENASGCDAPVGTLTSPAFKVTEDFLNFLMAGGNGSAPVGMKLLDTADNEVHSYSPNSCGPSHIDGDNDWTAVDMSAIRNAFVKLQLFDNEPGGCGFVSFDHFYQAAAAFNPGGTGQDGGTVALTPAVEATLGFNVMVPSDGFEQVIGDFDDATSTGWAMTGAFMAPAGPDAWQGVSGAARVGARAVSTCELNNNSQGCDAPVGTITSPGFTVDAARPFLNFLMAGGNGTAPVGLNVKDMANNVLLTHTPNSCGPAAIDGEDDWVTFDLSAQAGNMVQIEIFDNEPGGCGFVSFDHVHMSATAKVQ